jgi:superfamily I DNA/RNA helicase
MASFTPTPQQLHAIDLVGSNDFVKIDAGAGAAKTTTLALIAEQYVVPSLYLAFNKSMSQEAEEKFPSWVTTKTTHGQAYGVFGSPLQRKLSRPEGRYENVCGTGSEVAKYFKIAMQETVMGKRITASGIGQAVRETVNNFEYSDATEITWKHISHSALKKICKEDHFDVQFYNAIVLDYARKLWALRINIRSNILATHDTYLKLYQLSQPDLSKYEIIYLDEAQDTNDCVLDIIKRQKKVVFVGDKRQQIYGFRGSVNAMAKIDCATGYLTTSFRFGQAVADLANIVLENTSENCLKGWDQLDTVVVSRRDVADLPVKHTRLYRTNAALLSDAVNLISKGLKVNLEIDIKDFLRKLESAVELKAGNMSKVKHEEFLAYDNWKELEDENPVGEMGRIYNIVQSGHHYEVIGVLTTHKNTDNPDIIMTTAHKSKGREWDYVLLADDFPGVFDKSGAFVGLDEMEQNLLYVALTRAKKWLCMNQTLEDLVSRYKYN